MNDSRGWEETERDGRSSPQHMLSLSQHLPNRIPGLSLSPTPGYLTLGDGSQVLHLYCGSQFGVYFAALLLFWIMALCTWGCYLSYYTWNTNALFSEARWMAAGFYIAFILAIVASLVLFSTSNPATAFMLRAVRQRPRPNGLDRPFTYPPPPRSPLPGRRMLRLHHRSRASFRSQDVCPAVRDRGQLPRTEYYHWWNHSRDDV